MGDAKNNPFVPLQINYVYEEAEGWEDEPWNAGAKMCNETYDVSMREK